MKELAGDGIPVTVTCRVLKLARQPYYRWLAHPITESELVEAYRANALFDAHKDDPEFGHRFLVDEASDHGQVMSVRTAWRICRDNGWWSAFGKKSRGKNGKKAGPPVHDDRVGRDFTADAPNELWLTDITEHRTAEGKLYLCAIKDVFSNRIVGYSISDRMKSRLAVDALENAVARRQDTAGCIVHSDRGSQTGLNWSSQRLEQEVVRRCRMEESSGRREHIGVRFIRPGGLRSPGGRIGSSSGPRSLRACSPKSHARRPECPGQSGFVGSVTLAG